MVQEKYKTVKNIERCSAEEQELHNLVRDWLVQGEALVPVSGSKPPPHRPTDQWTPRSLFLCPATAFPEFRFQGSLVEKFVLMGANLRSLVLPRLGLQGVR